MQKMRRVFFLMLTLLYPATVFGAVDPVPGMMTQWKTITTAFGTTMVHHGAMLLFTLAGIQFTMNGLNALRKGTELQEMVMHMVWTLFTITFFFAVINKSPTWFPYIIDQWNALGGAGTHTGPLDPGAIFGMGIDIVETIRATVSAKSEASVIDLMNSIGFSFQVLFVELFILLSFLVLAGQLALAMLKGYLWFCLGPVLLGFGGMKYTQDVALNTLKSAISIGVTILTCYAIAAMAQASVGIFNAQIATFELTNWWGLWNCVGVAALIALAAWNVPKIANDFVNGSISGGLGETFATGAASAGGAAAVAGGVAGMLENAGQKAAAKLEEVAHRMDGGGSPAGGGVGAIAQAGGADSPGGSRFGGGVGSMLDTSPSQMRSAGGNDVLGGGTSRGADMSPAGGTGKDGGASDTPTGGQAADRNGDGASSGSANLGDGTQAKLSPQGGGSSGSISNEQLGKQLEELAGMIGQQNQPTVAERIRNIAGYVPSESQGVSVNAQLGGGHE